MRKVTLSILIILTLASTAVAQDTSPRTTLVVKDLMESFGKLDSNQSKSASFSVDMSVANVVCPSAVTVPMTFTVTATGAPAFVTVTVDPATFDVDIPPGVYGSAPAGSPFTTNVPAKITVDTSEVTDNATISFAVTASTPSIGCTPAGPAKTSDPGMVTAETFAPPPPPVVAPPPEETPGPGALFAILGVVAAAIVLRRR